MSSKTKTTDTNTIQYQPQSMNTYNALQPDIQNTLQQYMQNPLTSTFFNQRVGAGQNQISKMAAAGNQALLSNYRTSGAGGTTTNPFLQSMISRMGRTTSGMMSNNFLNQLFNANQMQLSATGMAQGYNPLMTGSTGTQTSTKSGLGTWLPQLVGAGLGAASGLAGLTSGGTGFQPTDVGNANPAPSLDSVGAFPNPTFPNPIFMGLPPG